MKAILIDDEKRNIKFLKELLLKHCENIEIIGEATSADTGAAMIRVLQPDLIFLDIQMPEKSGFEMLAGLGNYDFDVIFVTAYDQYAIKAIKCSALDYLLKPVKVDELIEAVNKSESSNRKNYIKQQLQNIQNFLNDPQSNHHYIIIPIGNDVRQVNPFDILYLTASDNYTRIFLNGGEVILVAKTLQVYDEMLSTYGFIRCHKSHLVNRKFIMTLHKGKVVYELILTGGIKIPVSGRKVAFVKELLNGKGNRQGKL